MYCIYCGSHKHTIVNCPKTWDGSSRHKHMRCTHCGGKDHEIEACPKTWDGSVARKVDPESVENHFVLDKD